MTKVRYRAARAAKKRHCTPRAEVRCHQMHCRFHQNIAIAIRKCVDVIYIVHNVKVPKTFLDTVIRPKSGHQDCKSSHTSVVIKDRFCRWVAIIRGSATVVGSSAKSDHQQWIEIQWGLPAQVWILPGNWHYKCVVLADLRSLQTTMQRPLQTTTVRSKQSRGPFRLQVGGQLWYVLV